MDERRSLLDAVIAAPDDDAPRLACAQWLDQQGERERAEFIRVQCALDPMPADDPRRPELQGREAELLEQYGWIWAEELGTDITEWVFRRGFIERVAMSLERPADRILAVLGKAPIRHVRDIDQFCDLDGVVDALPHLERLTGLEFWGLYAFKNSLVEQLLQSPHLRNLRTLILHHDRNGNLVKDQVLIDGLASPHRASLRELAVNVDGSWRGPSPAVIRAMAGSSYLADLRRLDLSNTRLDVETVRALGTSPAFARLEALDLGGCRLTSEVWDTILQLVRGARLRWLRLTRTARIDQGLKYLGDLKDLPEYRVAFEQAVTTVDWDSEFISPYDRNACWQGLTWEQRRRRPLFAMNRFVRTGDYDGLELEYRRMCQQLAGAEVRAEIDSLPFDRYEEELGAGLEQALAALPTTRGRALYLRMRPDVEWMTDLHIQEKDDDATDEPREEFGYEMPVAKFQGPRFPEAAEIYQRHPLHQGTRPSGPALYLLARTVAAFGRVLAWHEVRVPVSFSCMYAVLRMNARPS
jgi:uncharacterized protein (TIGR02996 family)